MAHLSALPPLLFVIFGAATLVFVFAFLLYSTVVPDSEFGTRRTARLFFRLIIGSGLLALGSWILSVIVLLFENQPPHG
jgi:hypothetical protein